MTRAAPALHPWDIVDGETSLAYQAFAIYRDMGPGRSLERVGAALAKSRQALDKWSVPNRWVERAAAFDAEAARIASAKSLNDHAEVRHRQAQAARVFQTRGTQRMATIDPSALTAGEAIQAFRVGTQVERDALGIAQTHELSGPGGGPVVTRLVIEYDDGDSDDDAPA